MKSILLHVDADQAFEARLQVALDMARANGGHITCLQTVNYEVFAPGNFYGSAMAAALPRIKEAARTLRDKVEADLANEDVSWEWRFLYGMAETRLLEQSALHDVIIIGSSDIGKEGGRSPSAMAGELAINAPSPVLVEVVEIPPDKQNIADTLFDAAVMRDCGVMVLGAYGHSRLAEMLMGGVTRKVLSNPKIPVLLAH
ncbi:MAG: universal stress protein [Erythrobacter sp.]|uniref:universal stress protein n=1 Tax=Erythrobacter sp. TaxID=1042 RepID=UPI0032655405